MMKQIFLLGTILVLVGACELANLGPTPVIATLTPITVPTQLPTLTPTLTAPAQADEAATPSPTPLLPTATLSPMLVSPTATPGTLNCVEALVPPQLLEAQPAQGAPGIEIKVIGTGGYIQDSCGGYNESARSFSLYFDDQPVGELGCYVNRCEGSFSLSAETQPGTHCISVEVGGCELEIQVVGN